MDTPHFNAVRYFENIAVKKDATMAKNDAPDMLYILYKTVIMFDHFNNQMKIIEMLTDGEENHIANVEKLLNKNNVQTFRFSPVGDTTSTLTDEGAKGQHTQVHTALPAWRCVPSGTFPTFCAEI